MREIREIYKKDPRLVTIAVVSVLLAISLFFLFRFQISKQGPMSPADKVLDFAIQKINNIRAYSQHVVTEAVVGRETITITGDYDINKSRKSYRSRSNTSTKVGEEEHTFILTNISIHDDIYTKVETESEFIKTRMPEVNKWRHFKAGQIPIRYQNIAIHGPVVDNLRLFSKSGKYIDLIEEQDGGHYIFKLSDEAFSEEGKLFLGTIVDRIGKDGTIDTLIDEHDFNIIRIKFSNPPYESTTEISNINNPPQIGAPVLQ